VSEGLYRCPLCTSTETPKLIVRGSGMRESGVSYRCRSCDSEWDVGERQGRAA
jgi:transposase-like protein